jgi:hypothetical protein
LAAALQGFTVLIIIVAVLTLAPRLSSANYVFTGCINESGFTDRSYVGAVGITAALFDFAGYEVQNIHRSIFSYFHFSFKINKESAAYTVVSLNRLSLLILTLLILINLCAFDTLFSHYFYVYLFFGDTL